MSKPWHPHMVGGIVGNHQSIETPEDAERLSNAMARDGHYPAGLSVCFAAGINGDSPNHCLFAFTDVCVCTPDEQGEWVFTAEEVAALLETRNWWVTNRDAKQRVAGPFSTQHDAGLAREIIERHSDSVTYWLEKFDEGGKPNG